MAGYGWLIAGGLGVLAVAAISSGGSSSGAKIATTTDPTTRFTIKRDVLTPGMELSLSDFKVGDVIGVTVQDSKLKIEYPILVKVVNALKDGLDTLYTPAVTMADGPPEMHFLVLPRDVISPMKKFGGTGVLVNHTMTDADVLMGPNVFATTYGFGTATGDAVKEMILANSPAGSTGFTDKPATVVDDGAKPGFYTTSGVTGTVTNGIISPWVKGQNVLVKRNPITIVPISFAGDGYGGAGFGGRGFGNTSIGSAAGSASVMTGKNNQDDYTWGYSLGVNAVASARAGATGMYSTTLVGLMDFHKGFYAGVIASGGTTETPDTGPEITVVPWEPPGTTVLGRNLGERFDKPHLAPAPARWIPSPFTQTYTVTVEREAVTLTSRLFQPNAYTWGRRPVRAF